VSEAPEARSSLAGAASDREAGIPPSSERDPEARGARELLEAV
jgi:hypothetical protein